MKASDLITVLCAAHLSRHVQSPFTDRGGIILIGPPGVLKSTFIDVLDANYHDVLQLSDINAKSLVTLRDSIASKTITTLCLPEMGKLYERHESTAKNVEGVLRALVAEGFQAASYEDQQVNRMKAKAMVIGAMTPGIMSHHSEAWRESGFSRRFLFPLIRLDNPTILIDAIFNWKLLDFDVPRIPRPPVGGALIPMTATKEERHRLTSWCKYQSTGANSIQVTMMFKILSVLRWWNKELDVPDTSLAVVNRFAESLGRQGGATVEMEIRAPMVPVAKQRQPMAKSKVKKSPAKSSRKPIHKGRRS